MRHATAHALLPDLEVLELRLGFNHLGNVGVLELVGGLEEPEHRPPPPAADAAAAENPWDASLAAQWTARGGANTTTAAWPPRQDHPDPAEWLSPGVHTLVLDLQHNLITNHDALDALGFSLGHHAALRDLSLILRGNLLRSLTGLLHLRRPRLRRLRLEVDYDPCATLPRRTVPVRCHTADLHALLLGLPLLRELYLAAPPELLLALDSVRFLIQCERLHLRAGGCRLVSVDPAHRRLWRDDAWMIVVGRPPPTLRGPASHRDGDG